MIRRPVVGCVRVARYWFLMTAFISPGFCQQNPIPVDEPPVEQSPVEQSPVEQPPVKAPDSAWQLALAASPPDRDRSLREIAVDEARAGRFDASIRAVSYLDDDRLRSVALREAYMARAEGGGVQADFDSLIDLIQSTIEPDSWEEVGTGTGSIRGFDGGVFVDANGLMHDLPVRSIGERKDRRKLDAMADRGNRDPKLSSKLRKVSLNRLEKQLQLKTALGGEPDDTARYLAGLTRIRCVFVVPETGDLILAGPAGEWNRDGAGRVVNTNTGRPVLHLDDLVVLLRNAYEENGVFGCSITPRTANLARARAFLNQSAGKPLQPGERERWVRELRDCLGRQDIEVYGIDPACRVAKVLVEADYHMKQIGLGLIEGPPEVTDYLSRLAEKFDGTLPPMDVLRWWFTLNYDALETNTNHDTFILHGQGVRVLSENELLTETGNRVHTGASDELNRGFAADFTRHFSRISKIYPIYGELRNVFDLALVATLFRHEDLPARLGWHMTFFGPPLEAGWPAYPVPLAIAPREVATIMNHRMLDRRSFVAGVSGGVTVRSAQLLQQEDFVKTNDQRQWSRHRERHMAPTIAEGPWWWD